MFQDIAVIPILAILPFLAVSAEPVAGLVTEGQQAQAGWLAGLKVIAVVVGIVVGGHYNPPHV